VRWVRGGVVRWKGGLSLSVGKRGRGTGVHWRASFLEGLELPSGGMGNAPHLLVKTQIGHPQSPHRCPYSSHLCMPFFFYISALIRTEFFNRSESSLPFISSFISRHKKAQQPLRTPLVYFIFPMMVRYITSISFLSSCVMGTYNVEHHAHQTFWQQNVVESPRFYATRLALSRQQVTLWL